MTGPLAFLVLTGGGAMTPGYDASPRPLSLDPPGNQTTMTTDPAPRRARLAAFPPPASVGDAVGPIRRAVDPAGQPGPGEAAEAARGARGHDPLAATRSEYPVAPDEDRHRGPVWDDRQRRAAPDRVREDELLEHSGQGDVQPSAGGGCVGSGMNGGQPPPTGHVPIIPSPAEPLPRG